MTAPGLSAGRLIFSYRKTSDFGKYFPKSAEAHADCARPSSDQCAKCSRILGRGAFLIGVEAGVDVLALGRGSGAVRVGGVPRSLRAP